MKRITVYLLLLAIVDVCLLVITKSGHVPKLWQEWDLIILCSLVGGLGGIVYCLRGIYMAASVRKNWGDEWKPWYYIRPIVSHVCGAISYLFLKAGLLVLEARQLDDATELGFLALGFIAGLNVDGFITKVEDIAETSWGIKKSRAAKQRNQNKN